jgi:hypothetical protein
MLTVVTHKSETVAIDVHFHNERISVSALSCKMNRRLVHGKKRCGSNKTFLLITRQFICAPNVRSVKRDATRTRKKSEISYLYSIRASPFAQETSMRQYNGAGMISP